MNNSYYLKVFSGMIELSKEPLELNKLLNSDKKGGIVTISKTKGMKSAECKMKVEKALCNLEGVYKALIRTLTQNYLKTFFQSMLIRRNYELLKILIIRNTLLEIKF